MQSSDEMAELWLLIVLKTQDNLGQLTRALQPRFVQDQILANEALLRRNPRNARALAEIGTALVMSNRAAEGLEKLRQSIEINPNYDEAHYFSGLALRMMQQLEGAQGEFEAALRINPRHGRARGNLGLVLMLRGNYPGAVEQFEMALQINPQDQIARNMLDQIRQQMTKPPQ
jgi:tetratricopeptide (TPR) repeat protein